MSLPYSGKSYEYDATCDVCGFKKKNWQLRKRWDNLMVCQEDWETRHSLDFFRTKDDNHLLPWTRPVNDVSLAQLTFWAEMRDKGFGLVDTTLTTGSGAITFIRATTAAARLSTGLWNLSVPVSTPRSHYLPNGVYGGYLSEAAATQLALDPRDMTTGNWTKTNTTAARTSAGLEGISNTANRITATGANGVVTQTLVAAATSRTYSCYIKRVSGSGTIQISQDNFATNTDITSQVKTGVYSLVQLNQTQLNSVFGIRLVTSGNSVDIDCNQFEAGAFATTPIPSGGSRSADQLTFALSGNFDTSKGSAIAEISSNWRVPGGTATIISSTSAVAFPLQEVNSSTSISTLDGTTTVTKTGLINYYNSITKVGSTWTDSRLVVTGSGLTPSSGVFDGVMDMNTFNVGSVGGGASNFNGTIKNLRIYSNALTDTLLQSYTS